MKRFDFDWRDFLRVVPAWEDVGREERLEFLEMDTYVQGELPEALKNPFETGRQVSLLGGEDTPAGDGVPQSVRTFWLGMRHFSHHRVYDAEEREDVDTYLSGVFSRRERAQLVGRPSDEYRLEQLQVGRLIASPDWVLEFRDSADAEEWEGPRLAYEEPFCFTTESAFDLAQNLLEVLMDLPGPVSVVELMEMCEDVSCALLAEVLSGCVRYALIFPSLGWEDLEPLIGIWPEVGAALHRPAADPPVPVEPEETFCDATLMEDMTSVLVACSSGTVRLRANDGAIFKREQRRIEERMNPLPGWMHEVFENAGEGRVERTRDCLQRLGMTKEAGEEGENLRLEATPEGREWLELSPKQRLKYLFDELRREPDRDAFYGYNHTGLQFVPGLPGLEKSGLMGALAAAFERTEMHGFVRCGEFLHYEVLERNPLMELTDYEIHRLTGEYYRTGARWLDADREDLYGTVLMLFLGNRLLPLGGVTVGRDGEGDLVFSLEDPGRYLLGLADDFDYGVEESEEVLVQPNFEITFLAPSPTAESAIGRFAERVGSRVGVMFKITRESITEAADAGLDAEEALGTLRNVSARPLPENVEREIRGWFERCCRLSAQEALLLKCPDKETAARVISAGGKHVTALTDTVIELPAGKKRTAVLRKLRKDGVFVEC